MFPGKRRRANIESNFTKGKEEDLVNQKLVNLTSIPGKITEHLIKECNSKHLEENKVIRNSQHEFIKSKSCLTNLISFHGKGTGSVDEWRTVDVLYLDFSNNNLINKLRKYRLDESTEGGNRQGLMGGVHWCSCTLLPPLDSFSPGFFQHSSFHRC